MNLDRISTIASADVHNKRVLVRADLNVPFKDGRITDGTRLERLIPGFRELMGRGAKLRLDP